MKQERRSKVLFIVNILMLIMLLAIPVYAYWGESIKGSSADDNETIEIGEGQEITTYVDLTKTVDGDERKLVPEGRVVDEDTEVDKVVLTFDVLWTDEKEASKGADGNLTITTSFGDEPEPGANLLNVVVNGGGAITAGATQTITITITLTEPADVDEYESVAGKEFTLAITFSVE